MRFTRLLLVLFFLATAVSAGEAIASEDNEGAKDHVIRLEQNYPNPFNSSTTINFFLPEQTEIKLEIYDLIGNRIKLALDEVKNEGEHSVSVNAGDLASGIYFYRLKAGDLILTRRMILIK